MDAHRWFDRSWLICWGLVSSIWCFTAADHLSATFDEPHYIKHGLHAWRSGSYHMLLRGGTMPLPTDVELLPVYVWEQVRDRPFNLDTEFATVLRTARASNLFFWWMLLYFSWRLGRRFGGPWAGRFAVVLIACEPNFLAHASLATTDIAISACLAMFTEFYLAGRDKSWLHRVGIPGLCFGFALLAKVSALAFGGLVMGAFELHRLGQSPFFRDFRAIGLLTWLRTLWKETSAFRRDTAQIIILGLAWVFIYCGSDWRAERGFANWARTLPDGLGRSFMVFFAENLRIFPNAGQGLFYQVMHNFRGHGVFVMGDWFPRAVWYYFPVALTMKLTLPVLVLIVSTFLVRPKSYWHPLGLLVAILFLFSVNCRVQIGIRLILPFLTFLMVALAVALVQMLPERMPAWVRPASFASVCLALVMPMLIVWPHGLCYFNPLWGGPEEGYRYLSDSNYDWGQGLDDLAKWGEQNAHPDMKIWYFGADPRAAFDRGFAPIHSWNVRSEEEFLDRIKGQYLAVGTTMMYSNPSATPASAMVLPLLKSRQPVARTMTFFIYDFTEPRLVVSNP
ncbi:MAG: glycosyltransferase family 39 protein [Planctomycetes bacterium]|nr:glycosyltransferase family 39 protein [Planctomycetota bacterium]